MLVLFIFSLFVGFGDSIGFVCDIFCCVEIIVVGFLGEGGV